MANAKSFPDAEAGEERIEHIGPEEPDTSLSVMGGQGD